jgi:hypothetical protein
VSNSGHAKIGRSVVGIALAGTVLAAGAATRSAASSQSSPVPVAERDCFHELVHGKGSDIACTFPVRMTDEELAGVRKATRDLLQDARCLMTIRIERRLIDEALGAADHVFQAPAQPVTCDVVTSKNTFPITFTFAPRVEFKDGTAVKASPVMNASRASAAFCRGLLSPTSITAARSGTACCRWSMPT